jgi:hypothetical protein
MANLMNVNGSLTNLPGESREFRLPRLNQFPKLDGHGLRVASTTRPAGRPGSNGTVLLAQGGGTLPEMTTDVIDQNASYAVENVKCDRSNGRRGAGVGLGRWLGQMLGGHRAARQ